MKIAYKRGRMGRIRREVVNTANDIIKEYQDAGYSLTLRQLFYQFVSRDLIPNTMKSYKRLGDIINEGRLLGLIDWEAIEDRTRNLESLSTWNSPHDIVKACADHYREDIWANQKHRVEVWVEKDALAGVMETACRTHRLPYLSCRGYTSQSEMWVAGRRLKDYADDGQWPVILHLGDHDPSGVDMSRDIEKRLRLFMEDREERLSFERIALNYDQVRQYKPPPNPAKITDSRAEKYIERYGKESWELDALTPQIITSLIHNNVKPLINWDEWGMSLEEEERGRKALNAAAKWVAEQDDYI